MVYGSFLRNRRTRPGIRGTPPTNKHHTITNNKLNTGVNMNVKKFTGKFFAVCFAAALTAAAFSACKDKNKGDQSWDFFGRNDAEAETPVL